MKFINILIILTLISNISYSQVGGNIISVSNSKSNVGFTLGALNIKNTFTLNENKFLNKGNGILIGLNYFKDLNKKWGISLENNLHISDLKNSFKFNNTNYFFQKNTQFNFLIKFQYNFIKEKIKILPDFINFGPVISYNFSNYYMRVYLSDTFGSIPSRVDNYNKINYNFVIGTGYKFDYKYGFVKAIIDFPFLNFLNNKTYSITIGDGSTSSTRFNLNNFKENILEAKFIFGSNAKKIVYRKKN